MTELDDVLGTATEVLTVSESTSIPEDVMQTVTTDIVEDMGKINAVTEADQILAALMGRIAPVQAVKYRKVLLYGPPGVGKTVLTATAPKPLNVAVEPTGPLSIANHPDLLAKNRIFQFVSVYQVETLLDKIMELPVEQVHEVFGETLVIDSFSELQNHDLDDIVTAAAKVDSSRNKYLPTGPDYNTNTEHMRQIGAKLEKIPMHVILTCHVKEEKDDSTGRMLMRPNLTPKLSRTMGGKFDVIGYMSMSGSGDSVVRTLQCHPTPTIYAKTRVGGIPAVVENPTWDALFGNSNTKDN